MPRALVLCSVLISLLACQPSATVGASCTRTSDCPVPLECSFGRCRTQCVDSRDCTVGLRCIQATGGGVCTLDAEERCTDAICASPLRCTGGQCRTECATSTDCHGGSCEGLTCVEQRSGDDASVAPVDGGADVGNDTGSSQCDVSTGVGHTALLDAILGAGHGPAGVVVTPGTEFTGIVSPQTSTPSFVPGQIAIAEGPSASVPIAWVAYLVGAEGTASDRALHIVEVTGDDLSSPRAFYPPTGSTPIARVRTFALAVDRDTFRGVAALEPPATGTETSAWIFASGPTEPVLAQITPMTTFPGQQPGRVAVVGGSSPFSTLTRVDPLWYVFRETHEDGTTSTPVFGRIDRGIGVGGYRSVDTMGELPDGYLATSASHGSLLVAFDGTSDVVAWDVRDMRAAVLVHLATDATGPPAIAFDVDDPDAATLVYPSGNAVRTSRIVCPAGALMDCHPSGTAHTIALGGTVRRVAAATVRGGVAVVALVDDTTDRVAHFVVDTDGNRVDDCDGGSCASMIDLHPTHAGERVVDLAVASAPSPRGVAITMAVLMRDEGRALDRVSIDGLWLCTP